MHHIFFIHSSVEGYLDEDTHCQASGRAQESVEEVWGEVIELEGSRAPQEGLQSQLTWAHKRLTETEPLTKEHAGNGASPHVFVVERQLCLHVCPLTIGVETISDSVAYC